MIPQQEGFCNPQLIIVMRDFHGSDSVQHTVAFPVTYDYCSFVFFVSFSMDAQLRYYMWKMHISQSD